MIDLVELQQIISNLPSIEKVASTPQALAVNLNNIAQKEMKDDDTKKLSTVVELSEVLEPINDKNKNSKNKEKSSPESDTEESDNEGVPHINITA